MSTLEAAVLFFDPMLIHRYRAGIGRGTQRHQHPSNEPCHFLIVAKGWVRVDIFKPEATIFDTEALLRSHVFEAGEVYDFCDGTETHHQITALEEGSVFFNIPRVPRATFRQFVAEELEWAP